MRVTALNYRDYEGRPHVQIQCAFTPVPVFFATFAPELCDKRKAGRGQRTITALDGSSFLDLVFPSFRRWHGNLEI